MTPSTTSHGPRHTSPGTSTTDQSSNKRSLRNRSLSTNVKETSSASKEVMDGIVVVGEPDQPVNNNNTPNDVNGDTRVNGDGRKRKRSPVAGSLVDHGREKRVSVAKTKETNEQIQLRQFMDNLLNVLESRDTTPSVIHFSLPLNEGETKRKNEERTTMYSKLSNHEYSSISQIEDDLILAAQELLKTLPTKTEPYTAITQFFSFAQDLLITHQEKHPSEPKTQHSLRSSSVPNGASTSPSIPTVKPPLREALYTMGPNGPLFTSIASPTPLPLSQKLPQSITLPTITGGTFTASSAQIVPTNLPAQKRSLADSLRARQSFERRRTSFSDENLGRLGVTKWLEWGHYSSFAPMWDDGGVGGGFGAEWMVCDWAYKKSRRERRGRRKVESMDLQREEEEVIDEKLVLEWEPPKVSEDLLRTEEEEEEEMSVDETLEGLRGMIVLLGQMQTLRLASGNTEIPDDEMALANNIVATFQDLIITHNIPPKSLISSLPKNAYNILHLSHPDFTGSLPSKSFTSWAPPQPQQRYPTPASRPLQIRDMNPGQRYYVQTPGSYRPASSGQQRYPVPPVTPGSATTASYMPGAYTPASRGVGRPRKYDVRR